MRLPTRVREELRGRLYGIADSVQWAHLSPTAKSKYYEEWTRAPEIGGILARYMDGRRIRVYLKDTLLKDYTRMGIADEARPLRVLGIAPPVLITERFVKPHGLRLKDGRVLAWGRADEWKLILMAIYERAHGRAESAAYGAVLLGSFGRFDDPATRLMVEEAGRRLGVEHLVWMRT